MFLDKQSASVILYLYHTIAYFLVVKRQCLLMSGDVELNPGPLDQETVDEILSTVDDTTFDEESWNDVIIACSPLAAKWKQLSGFMGLSFTTIRTIKDSNDDNEGSWNEALMQWILRDYNTEKYGLPSWKSLLKTVSRVDQSLFEKLAREHQAKDDKLAPMSGQAVEKPEDTASHADTTCDTNIAVSSSLITDGTQILKQGGEKPEDTVSNADTGYETSSVISASSSSQITKQVAMGIEIPDHILSQIRNKYRNIKNAYKKQCPCQLRNIANLELVEGQQDLSNQSIDERGITGKSIRLSYSSLFKGDQDRKESGTTRILIVGEAGIGKTILCASIAEDWANGKLFQEFLMVFLLPLNQRGIASAQNLQELFKNLEFDNKVCSIVATYLMANKKENILMIADGWDELSESNGSKESFLYRLLFGDLVPNSSLTVVVTSKSAPVIQQSISRFITVNGFSEETTKSYIQCEFSGNPEKLSSTMTQLESNPLLGDICSVPLSLSMICSYLQSCDDPLPSTMPELYEKLAWNLAQSKINSTKGYENVLIQKLSNYQDLPNELQQSWSHLCRLAFEKCQFDCSQAVASTYLSTGLDTFSLLMPAAVGSDEVIFSFLCPALRYYLAVSHLTTQPQSKQLEVIKSMRHINPMFCRFYLSVSENPSSDIVSEVVQKLHNCCKDMCLLSFESKNEIVDREVAKSLHASGSTIMLHAQNAYECVAMVHVLEKIEQPSSVEINFKNCKLKTRQVSKLAGVLGNRSKMIQVKGLDLSDNGLSDAIIADFFSRASSAFSSLEKLFLRSCDIGEVGFRAIIDALAKSSCKSLSQVDLSFNSLSVASLECFQKHIDKDGVKKMEILILKGSLAEDINVSFLKSFAITLSTKCQHLRRLDLSGNKLGACNDPEFSAIVSQLTARLGTNFDLQLDDMSEVDKNFLTIMEESISTKGTIDHTIAHGVIVGPGRSGKNTLLKRLTGEGPPDPSEVSPSTGVLENVVKVEVKKLCAVASDKCNLKWRKLKYDEEALELMMTTAKNYLHSSDVPRPVTIKYIYLKKSESVEDLPQPSKTKSDQASKQDTPKADKLQESECTTSEHTENIEEECKHMTIYRSDVAPVDVFKKAVKLRRMDALREHLESSWSLYLTNTGGQIEFQEHLPLLVCGPSIFFVTFPLHHDLDKPYEVRYEYPDGSVEKYSSPSSLMEEILQTLATIYTLDFVSVQIRDEEITLKPTIFIIGTHRDCLKSETEEIAQIEEKIQRYVKQTSLYHQGSIQFASDFENCDEDHLIFTVNSLSKGDTDFQKIRFAVQQMVEKRCHKEFTVQCPSSWLIFSLILREKHKSRRVLRFEDCFKIAQECGISNQEELTIALSFIHSRLGLVRYSDIDELSSLVVIDPQILFDKITDLILETFSGKTASHKEIEEFRQRGIISLAVMKRISEGSSEKAQLPLTWLTKVLNHLRLAALFKDQYGEKFFFPSALCHVSKAPDFSEKLTPCNTPPKALIAFEPVFCPRGIAGALIKCLMTNEMNSRKEWYLLPHKIFRNQVSFNIGDYDVTLKILPTHLEIILDPEEDSSACADSDESSESETELTRSCAYKEVYTQIDKCMKIVTKLYKKCEYFWTFYCTLPDCKTHPHPAVIASSQPLKLRCKIFHKRTNPPKGCKILWNIYKRGLNKLDVEVKESHLGEVADSMTEWEGLIADKLKLKSSDVANIKSAYPKKLNLQKREALYTWKKRNGSKATYTKMIKIFEQAGYKTYADEVRKIAHISNSDTDDSSDSGEEHPQIEQPQTYPDYKPRALPRVPQPMTSTELTEVYVMVKEENLPKGDAGEVCSEEVLKSQNKSFVPQFTSSTSGNLNKEQPPKVAVSEAEGSIPAPSKDRTATNVACIFPDIDDILSTVSDEIFGIEDWNWVFSECKKLSAHWYDIGAHLGLNPDDLECIKRYNLNSKDCLMKVLYEWIKQNYAIKNYGLPSWKTLLEAVASVDQRLFKKLAEKYKATSSGSNTSTTETEASIRKTSISLSELQTEWPSQDALPKRGLGVQRGYEVQATADQSTIASDSRSPKWHSQAPLSSVLHNKESSANTYYTAAKFSPLTEEEGAKGSTVSHSEANKHTRRLVHSFSESISPGDKAPYEEHSFAIGSSGLQRLIPVDTVDSYDMQPDYRRSCYQLNSPATIDDGESVTWPHHGRSSQFNPDFYAEPKCSRASDQLYVPEPFTPKPGQSRSSSQLYVPTNVYYPESDVKSDVSRSSGQLDISVSIADPIINFKLKFEQSRLEVLLGKAINLPKEGMHCDPFVVLHLEPSRKETFKSKVIKGTRDPEFHQIFQFERMSVERIQLQTLVLRIYNSALKNKAIGKVCLPISEVQLSGTGMRMNITSREEMESNYQGDLLLSLEYNPVSCTLAGVISRATCLTKCDMFGKSDPYVKVIISHHDMRVHKFKTSVKNKTLAPVYNETFSCRISEDMSIEKIAILYFVIDHDVAKRNEVIGVVNIGRKVNSKLGREHWESVLTSPSKEVSFWHPIQLATAAEKKYRRGRNPSPAVL